MDYAALAQKYGGSVSTSTPSVPSVGNVDFESLAQKYGGSVATTSPHVDFVTAPSPVVPQLTPETTFPSAGSTILPSTPFTKEESPISQGLKETGKAAVNAVGDAWNIFKTMVSLPKTIAYDIPKEAIGLIRDLHGVGANEIARIVADTALESASSLIPQSAKSLVNTHALAEIPIQFHNLVQENGGSYAKAFTSVVKEIPGAFPQGVLDFANQVEEARQAGVNHPVYEALGWLGLKQLANPSELSGNVEQVLKSTKELVTNPAESLQEVGQNIKNIARPTIEAKQAKAVAEKTEAYQSQGIKYARTNMLAENAKLKGIDIAKEVAQRTSDLNLNPKIEDGRMYTLTQASEVAKTAEPLYKLVDTGLEEFQVGKPNVSLEEVRNLALSNVDEVSNLTETSRNSIKQHINEEFDLQEAKHGNDVTLMDLNKIKRSAWSGTKFDTTKPLMGDATYQIGKAAETTIEERVGDAFPVKELNKEIAKVYESSKFLRALNRTVVQGGRLGKYASRIFGLEAGKLVGGLPGAIGGYIAGDVIQRILQSTQFSNPLKDFILKSYNIETPAAVSKASGFVQSAQEEAGGVPASEFYRFQREQKATKPSQRGVLRK